MKIHELFEADAVKMADFSIDIYKSSHNARSLTTSHLNIVKQHMMELCVADSEESGVKSELKQISLEDDGSIKVVITAPADTDPDIYAEAVFHLQLNKKIPTDYDIIADKL